MKSPITVMIIIAIFSLNHFEDTDYFIWILIFIGLMILALVLVLFKEANFFREEKHDFLDVLKDKEDDKKDRKSR